MEIAINREIKVSNREFLAAIFGEEWDQAHITAFPDDPADIAPGRRGACWAGYQANARALEELNNTHNQYFTISLFKKESRRAPSRRRKALFDACFVIVADDVHEKLPVGQVEKLPPPSYKLVTSPGSEQWGWILAEACEDAGVVNNLLDGLVAKGLAPDGNDPGMKGVTRYVRLPEGSNTKKKKFVEGKPFKCYLYEWAPERTYSIEALAEVFDINLYLPRAETETQSLSEQHPLFKNHPIFQHVTLSGTGNEGFKNIAECVNAEEHSGGDPTGAGIKIADDGSLHYKCHHGHCSGENKITGVRALELIDKQQGAGGGFLAEVDRWRAEFSVYGTRVLKSALGVGEGDLVAETGPSSGVDIDRYIFIKPFNQFYDTVSGQLMVQDALNSFYLDSHPGTKGSPKAAKVFFLTADKKTHFADGLGWVPTGLDAPQRNELVFEDEGARLVNSWRGAALTPAEGDCGPWLELCEYLLPDAEEREGALNFLAAIVQRIAEKPGFCLLHRGNHRVGKDLFYKPLFMALGGGCTSEVSVEQMVKGWGDYLQGQKLVAVTEVDNAKDHKVANAMKTFLAPTASGKRKLNLKGGKVITQVDCTGYVMMSNYRAPVAIERGNRRYFVVDSWVKPKEPEFYQKIDSWYRDEQGAAKVLRFLLDRDISGFNSSVLPFETKGFREIVRDSRYDYIQTLEELIDEGAPPFHLDIITTKELRKARDDYRLTGAMKNIQAALENDLGWVSWPGGAYRAEGGEVRKLPRLFTRGVPATASTRELARRFDRRYELTS